MDLGLQRRNYLREIDSLVIKTTDSRVDPKKRHRCVQRLADLTGRLLPELRQRLKDRIRVLATARGARENGNDGNRIERIAEQMDRLGATLPPDVLAKFISRLPYMTSGELDEWLKKHDTVMP